MSGRRIVRTIGRAAYGLTVFACFSGQASSGRGSTDSPLNLPSGDLVEATAPAPKLPSARGAIVDPDLEPGFPVKALHLPGTCHGGPALHALVGNINADQQLEILVPGLSTGPLYAWKPDGSLVPGWPVSRLPGVGYMVLGEFQPDRPGLEVFSGHFAMDGPLAVWRGNGRILPGWPQPSWNFVTTPGTAADVDGDGVDEIFICEEDGRIHGYRAIHWPLVGWPVENPSGGQDCHTPAAADLDGDKQPEIISASGWTTGGGWLVAYHGDGTPATGFPFYLPFPKVDGFAVVGDVDADGQPEIVLLTGNPVVPYQGNYVLIVGADGTLERSIYTPEESHWGSAPALADLDGDGVPEIIVQMEKALHVWKGDGTYYPGWPRNLGSFAMGNSAPIVGDVTGDGLPDIVVTIESSGGVLGSVLVFDRDGNLHPHFPKMLPISDGGAPAIADIDRDGRNEIVIIGSSYDGYPGMTDRVWVYDLGGGPHGPILWGQFMGGPKHQGRYPVTDPAP